MNVKLMKAVRKRVLQDYKHVIMDYWLDLITPQKKLDNKAEIKLADYAGGTTFEYLSCGTAGCIAGHTLIESLKPDQIKRLADKGFGSMELAETLLELNKYEANALFMFFDDDHYYFEDNIKHDIDNDIYNTEREALKFCKPGTKKYAQVVAKAIDKCIARNS